MGIFHQVNSLVVIRNLWLISLSKIGLFLILSKHTSKTVLNSHDSKSVLIFSLASVVAELLAIIVFLLYKNYITYLGPKLLPRGKNLQLIYPNLDNTLNFANIKVRLAR